MAYLNYFTQYITDHKSQIKGKEDRFTAFLNIIAPIIQKNMQALAKNTPPPPQVGPDGKPIAPTAPAPTISIPNMGNKIAGMVQ